MLVMLCVTLSGSVYCKLLSILYVLKCQIQIRGFMCQQRCFVCHVVITICSKQAIQICTFLYCTYWHHWSEMHIFTNRPVTDKFPAKKKKKQTLKSRNKIGKTQCLLVVSFYYFHKCRMVVTVSCNK